jgi:hypothetical protein
LAKKVELKITIDEKGNPTCEAVGTVGDECVGLMKFLETIPGMVVTEHRKTSDAKKKEVHTLDVVNVHH